MSCGTAWPRRLAATKTASTCTANGAKLIGIRPAGPGARTLIEFFDSVDGQIRAQTPQRSSAATGKVAALLAASAWRATQQGTAARTVMDLYTCNGGTSQEWTRS